MVGENTPEIYYRTGKISCKRRKEETGIELCKAAPQKRGAAQCNGKVLRESESILKAVLSVL